MTKNDLIDKTLDIILYYTAPLAEKDMLDKLPSIEELNEDISFSKEHREKMNILFNKQYRKEKIFKIMQCTKRAAVWLFIISVLVGTISYYSVEAFRLNILNLGLQFKEGYANIFIKDRTTDSDNTNNNDSIKIGNIEFGYIPDGFELETYVNNEDIEFKHTNNPSFYISLQIMISESEITADTEDGYTTKIKINGNDAFLFKKGNEGTNLVWSSDNVIFSLSGNIADSEIIKIAENLKKH